MHTILSVMISTLHYKEDAASDHDVSPPATVKKQPNALCTSKRCRQRDASLTPAADATNTSVSDYSD